MVPRTIYPFPRCPKQAWESRLLKLLVSASAYSAAGRKHEQDNTNTQHPNVTRIIELTQSIVHNWARYVMVFSRADLPLHAIIFIWAQKVGACGAKLKCVPEKSSSAFFRQQELTFAYFPISVIPQKFCENMFRNRGPILLHSFLSYTVYTDYLLWVLGAHFLC